MLVSVIIQLFKKYPRLSWLPIIVLIVGSDARQQVDWVRLWAEIDKIPLAKYIFLNSTVWSMRKETMHIHHALIQGSRYPAVSTYYDAYKFAFPTYDMDFHERSAAIHDMFRWLSSAIYEPETTITWIKHLRINPIDFILHGLVSCYCNNTYMVIGKEYHLKRAQQTLLLWIKSAVSQAQVGFTKKQLQAREQMHYWPACQLGYTMCLGKPNDDRKARVQIWNDWVDKNISAWIR